MSNQIKLLILLFCISFTSCKKDDDSTPSSGNIESGYYIIKYKGWRSSGYLTITDTVYTFKKSSIDLPFVINTMQTYGLDVLSDYVLSLGIYPNISKGTYGSPSSTANMNTTGQYFLRLEHLAPTQKYDYKATSGNFVIDNADIKTIELYEGVNPQTKDYLVVNGKWTGILKNSLNSETHNAEITFVNTTFEK